MRRSAVPALVLAGLVVGAAGVAAGFALVPATPPQPLRTAAPVRSVPVATQEHADERVVQVALEIDEDRPLRTAARGTVTGSAATAGAPLESGDVAFHVDDEAVIAVHTSLPLYRDLVPGLRGNDVRALHEELVRLGAPAALARSDRYGASTRSAVRDLQRRAGTTRPSGEIRLDRVLWLPTPRVVPERWTVQPGSVVPDDGEVGSLGGRLVAVRVSAPPVGLAPGARSLTVLDASAVLDDDLGTTDPDLLRTVEASDDYATLRAVDEETGTLRASMRLVESVVALRVPPTALFGQDGRSACVESDGRTYPVTLVGSGLGASLVTLDDESIPPTSVDVGASIGSVDCR